MKNIFKTFKTKKLGLSLVEVLVALAILAFISIAVGAFAGNVFSLNTTIQNGLSVQQDARQVVKQIAAELREASISSTGAYPIEVASTSEIIFYDDIDNDGLKEKVRYYLSGLILKKDVVKPSGNPLSYSGGTTTSNIINDVRNSTTSIFLYYDKNYDGTTAPLSFPVDLLQIRLVKVSLSVDRDPYRSPVPVFITTQVTLRNLKDNL
jgi:prepilin-type N-terminal cleavage/methylation domain-containing protein